MSTKLSNQSVQPTGGSRFAQPAFGVGGGCLRWLTLFVRQHDAHIMSGSGYKRLTIALGVVCVGMLVLSGFLFGSYGWLKIRVAYASEQTQIFDQMRTQALQSDPAGAAGCLEYVVSYYPSGSKQETGSRLDRMVERERTLAVRDILAYLRTKTGEDLGKSPEAWIHKYAKR